MPAVVAKSGIGLLALVLGFVGVNVAILTAPPAVTITGHQGTTYYGYLKTATGDTVTFNADFKYQKDEPTTFGKKTQIDPGQIDFLFHKKSGEVRIQYKRDMGAGPMSDEDAEFIRSILEEIGKYEEKLEEEVMEEEKSTLDKFLDWINKYRRKPQEA